MARRANNATATKGHHHRRGRFTVTAVGTLMGCVLYVFTSVVDLSSYGPTDRRSAPERLLLRPRGGIGMFALASARMREFVYRLRLGSASATVPAIVSHGAGPEFHGPAGKYYKFRGEVRQQQQQGAIWHRILSSPRFQWNAAAHHWKTCSQGESMFLGDTGFTFHEPNRQDETKMLSKHLRFRILRRSERECLWNYSKSCLAGGNFVMNFGKTAPNMLYPGDYPLKTSDGVIRIVAYNTNRDCSMQINGRPDITISSQRAGKKTPIDYLRRVQPSTINPAGCEAWIRQRESGNDLFSFNSDISTIHIDTPWMQIVIQVRQNKVATEKTCAYANMNVWITNIDPEVSKDGFSGVLGENQMASPGVKPIVKSRGLNFREAEEHEAGGPFDR